MVEYPKPIDRTSVMGLVSVHGCYDEQFGVWYWFEWVHEANLLDELIDYHETLNTHVQQQDEIDYQSEHIYRIALAIFDVDEWEECKFPHKTLLQERQEFTVQLEGCIDSSLEALTWIDDGDVP